MSNFLGMKSYVFLVLMSNVDGYVKLGAKDLGNKNNTGPWRTKLGEGWKRPGPSIRYTQ